MGKEIERKFEVKPGWPRDPDAERLEQFYLCLRRECSVRIRIAGDDATVTIKGQTHGIERTEFEYPIPCDDARELRDLAQGDVVEKTRHRIRVGDHLWEIDEFHGRNGGLVIAEVELAAPDQAFDRPDWLGTEVSDEPRYLNVNLAQRPYDQWSDADR